jgi:hypothetical protein
MLFNIQKKGKQPMTPTTLPTIGYHSQSIFFAYLTAKLTAKSP